MLFFKEWKERYGYKSAKHNNARDWLIEIPDNKGNKFFTKSIQLTVLKINNIFYYSHTCELSRRCSF